MHIRAGPLTVAAVLAVELGVVVAWLALVDELELRRQLMAWQFWVLEAQFLALALLSWMNLPRLVRSLQVGRWAVAAVTAASGLALLLALLVAPRTNRIFYDEHIYQGIGQNLSDLHRAQMCNDGIVEHGRLTCSRDEYNKEPYGYPYLLSVAYRAIGVKEAIAHVFNTFCAAALVWVVFLITSSLFDQRAGVFAALITALIPQQLLWAHSAAVEPSAGVMCAVAVLAAIHYTRAKTTASLLWMVVASAFALQFRIEAMLILTVVAIVLALFAPESFTRPTLWWGVALGLGLCAAHIGHLFAVRNDSWGAMGTPMSLEYFWPNLKVNGPFYLTNVRFPVLYSALALCAVAFRWGRGVLVAAVFFLLFWGVYLFFYAGSYDYGADVRFSLMTYPALAILAGVGAATVLQLAAPLRVGERRAAAVIATAIAIQFLWFLPQVRAVGEESWAARADVAFAREVAGHLPANSVVLTHNPSMFLLYGVNSAQMSLVTTDSAYVASALPKRFAGGVYLHWNAWCNFADPVQQAFCTTSLQHFPSTLLKEFRVRDFRYAFYRLEAAGLDPRAARPQP